MPPTTASLKPGPSAAPKGSTMNGSSSSPSSATAPAAGSGAKLSKPDQAAYNATMDGINKEIEEVKAKLNDVRSKLSLLHAPSSSNDRRSQIRAEMDALVGKQGEARTERQKTIDQVKRLQESVQTKIKDLQAQRSKLPYKSNEDVDARIAQLDKQIESGSLKLIDEKKALQEISNLRRSKHQLTALGNIETAIAADRTKIDELKTILDDPENKKKQAKFEELKKELDELKKEGNQAYEQRSALFEQRNALQKEMDALYGRKREVSQKHRDDNDAYYARVQEERRVKQERFRAQKLEEENSRKKEDIERMREEAKIPAFSREIEDCGVLIGWFQGKYGAGKVPETHAGGNEEKNALEGVKQLSIRKVEDAPPTGAILKKNRDDDDDSFFKGVGGKKGKKGARSGTSTPGGGNAASSETSSSSAGPVNLPMGLLTALLSLSIPPPTSASDFARVVSDLEHKRDWFLANQKLKTQEEIERVEKVIAKMEKKMATGQGETEGDDVAGAKEPVHTAVTATSGSEVTQAIQDAQIGGDEHGLSPNPDAEQVNQLDDELKEAKVEQHES